MHEVNNLKFAMQKNISVNNETKKRVEFVRGKILKTLDDLCLEMDKINVNVNSFKRKVDIFERDLHNLQQIVADIYMNIEK